MTDEHNTGEGMGDAPEPKSPAEQARAALGDFSSGEGLVALAGLILLAVWLIFDVFLDDYGLGNLELLIAVTVVLAPRLNRESVERAHPLPVVMMLGGYALAVIGVLDVIEALEEGFYEDALTIVAALASYVGYGVAFMGARSIKT